MQRYGSPPPPPPPPPKHGLGKPPYSAGSITSQDKESHRGNGMDGVRVSMSSASSGQEDGEPVCDLFMWGQGAGGGVLGGGVKPTGPLESSTADAFSPKQVRSLVSLDVNLIAAGVRHAALISKQGEVFTWGEQGGGRLGHGIDADVSHPQLVEPLASLHVQQVVCGEYHSCAVTQTGHLYTWGDGTHNFGLLGHGNNISHWTPRRVDGPLERLRVASVACGPWHTAIITSTGQLFSFGDGTFGVLGHGDRQSVSSPKEVESLKGLKTVQVACGPWHTAAIVEIMVGYSNATSSSSGKLFTWGDGDKYRLGHGDKEQRLTPTCVAALVDYNFTQVACGHSLTVALTTTGHVYTMGSTAYGQLGDPHATGKLPGLLRLGKVLFESVSCGAYHVAALTSKGEVYTWGKGANGRLGHGDGDDRSEPVLVEGLKDRQVKRVACGSSFTAAVCLQKPGGLGTGSLACSACRQAFGFTRKKHSCYNCGLAHCHSCSSKKALYAAFASSPRKPHRVCDTCYLKLSRSGVSAGTMMLKAQRQGNVKATTKRSKRPDSSSRVSPMPSSVMQWGGVNAPATFNVIDPPETLRSVPASRAASRAVSPLSRRPSPPRAATPTLTVAGMTSPKREVDEVKKKNEALLLENSRLKAQLEKATRRCETYEQDLAHSTKQIQDAFAIASAETAKCKAAKEVIMSLTAQLKDLAERMPPGTYRAYRAEVYGSSDGRDGISSEVPPSPADVNNARSFPAEEGQQREWVEQDQPGVYITLTALPGGGMDLKRVRFSRKRFSERQAEIWWQENRHRVYEEYNVRGKNSGAPSSRPKDSSSFS